MTRALRLSVALTAAVLGLGCGGGGGSAGPTTPGGSASKLFILANSWVLGFDDPLPAPGALRPDRKFDSTQSFLSTDLAYDPGRDELYVTNESAGAGLIAVFQHPGTLDGRTLLPTRIIQTTAMKYDAIALDTERDVLYVAGHAEYMVPWLQVLEHASSLDGTVTPSRTVKLGGQPLDLALDGSRSILYALFDSARGTIAAYEHLDTIDGAGVPYRVVMTGGLANGIALDPVRDTLYVAFHDQLVTMNPECVLVVPSASTVTNASASTSTQLPILGGRRLDLDHARDRLYVLSGSSITVVDHVSTAAPGAMTTVELQGATGSDIEAAAFAP